MDCRSNRQSTLCQLTLLECASSVEQLSSTVPKITHQICSFQWPESPLKTTLECLIMSGQRQASYEGLLRLR